MRMKKKKTSTRSTATHTKKPSISRTFTPELEWAAVAADSTTHTLQHRKKNDMYTLNRLWTGDASKKYDDYLENKLILISLCKILLSGI